MKPRIVVARLFHETNTFLEGYTCIKQFCIKKDRELINIKGDNSTLDAFFQYTKTKKYIIIPAVDMTAMPGPIVKDLVVEEFLRSFKLIIEQELDKGIDGIYLVLHGSMVSESIEDVEGFILKSIKNIKGLRNVPICGVLDLHANFTDLMAQYSDGFIAYKKNPHTDAVESAIKGAQLLNTIIEKKQRPRTYWMHPPIVWTPTATATDEDPMFSLEKLARQIETKNNDIVSVNVFAGFAFADTFYTGVSFSIVTFGSSQIAKRELKNLSQLAIDLKERGNKIYPSIKSIIKKIKKPSKGTIIIVEPSDNIGAGSPGDCTEILRILVKYNIQNSVCIINDPKSVHILSKCSRGDVVSLNIGGKGSKLGNCGPLLLKVKLISFTNGQFELEDKQSHLASMLGKKINMGFCAVVYHKGIKILLTSKKTPPFDLGQLRSQGIIPEEQSVIVVKAAVAHHRAYDPITYRSYIVDTSGPCSGNLKKFPYRNIKRPIYPLDDI
jgi:microcystin degradation protein MlrC